MDPLVVREAPSRGPNHVHRALTGISIVAFQHIAPNTAYAAEPLDINSANADELKALPRHW